MKTGMVSNLRYVTPEEADALWGLGVTIWFKTSFNDWRPEYADPHIKPFWKQWVMSLPTSNPELAVEVE